MIYHIVAIDSNRCFARTGENGVPYIPWNLPTDKMQYKARIAGKVLLMGHATYHPRPDAAYSYVLSGDATMQIENGERVLSVEEAVENNGENDLWVIGGRSVYGPTMALASRVFVTHVLGEHGDVQYPEISPATFRLAQRSPEQTENGMTFWFAEYERIE